MSEAQALASIVEIASAAPVPAARRPVAPIDSDKSYWHRFTETYERAFASLDRVAFIMEFGVFEGDSVRWLAERFPEAQIVGCDIVPQRPSWPTSKRIGYVQIDQGAEHHLQALFRHFNLQFDLIIEDGSHHPIHQRNCLVTALPRVRPGGLYILEDIHTSHPANAMYQSLGRPGIVGPLHLLLAIEHLQATGATADQAAFERLATHSLFTAEEIAQIFERVQSVEIFHRAVLPLRCYQCGGSSSFDVGTLRCACGTNLYAASDSMTAVIRVRD